MTLKKNTLKRKTSKSASLLVSVPGTGADKLETFWFGEKKVSFSKRTEGYSKTTTPPPPLGRVTLLDINYRYIIKISI